MKTMHIMFEGEHTMSSSFISYLRSIVDLADRGRTVRFSETDFVDIQNILFAITDARSETSITYKEYVTLSNAAEIVKDYIEEQIRQDGSK